MPMHFRFEFTPDRSGLTITADTSDANATTMVAEDLDKMIRFLAAARAQMQPAHPVQLTVGTPVLGHAGMACYVGPDALPTQVRICMMHPGTGWIGMPLSEAGARKVAADLFEALRRRPVVQ